MNSRWFISGIGSQCAIQCNLASVAADSLGLVSVSIPRWQRPEIVSVYIVSDSPLNLPTPFIEYSVMDIPANDDVKVIFRDPRFDGKVSKDNKGNVVVSVIYYTKAIKCKFDYVTLLTKSLEYQKMYTSVVVVTEQNEKPLELTNCHILHSYSTELSFCDSATYKDFPLVVTGRHYQFTIEGVFCEKFYHYKRLKPEEKKDVYICYNILPQSTLPAGTMKFVINENISTPTITAPASPIGMIKTLLTVEVDAFSPTHPLSITLGTASKISVKQQAPVDTPTTIDELQIGLPDKEKEGLLVDKMPNIYRTLTTYYIQNLTGAPIKIWIDIDNVKNIVCFDTNHPADAISTVNREQLTYRLSNIPPSQLLMERASTTGNGEASTRSSVSSYQVYIAVVHYSP